MLRSVLLFLLALGGCASRLERPDLSPVIDAHAHVRLADDDALRQDQPRGIDALREIDASAGVEKSALIVIARRGDLGRTRRQNDAVLALAASSPHFYAVVSVHPNDGQAALDELERVAHLGAKEVKLHPNTQAFDVSDPAVELLADRCADLGLVILFDSYKPWDASEIGKFALLAIKHPKTRMVLAHMGFSQFRETMTFAMFRRLGLRSNVWFDISAIAPVYANSPMRAELLWTMRQLGTDRLLFGSDWPVFTPQESLAAVRRLGFTDSELKAILHDNVVRLLGL
jgi:predicted TIM-barrel fold metal-dependent hydrolase